MSNQPQLVVVDNRLVAMRFTILGEPVAKGRPRTRVVEKGNSKPFAQIYTDPQTRSWEENVGWQVRQQLGAWSVDPAVPGEFSLPLLGRIIMTLRFNFSRPKTLPKKVEFPLTKKDVDNLAKSVLDALQTVQVMKDDKQITDLVVTKRFVEDGHPEGVEVDLTGWVE